MVHVSIGSKRAREKDPGTSSSSARTEGPCWGAALDQLQDLKRRSNLDDGDWVAIESSGVHHNSSQRRMMWYNTKTGEHRWKEQPDAETLDDVRLVLKLRAGPSNHRHMLSASCELGGGTIYPVWLAALHPATGEPVPKGTYTCGINLVHSLPFIPPRLLEDALIVKPDDPLGEIGKHFGSAAADAALLKASRCPAPVAAAPPPANALPLPVLTYAARHSHTPRPTHASARASRRART